MGRFINPFTDTGFKRVFGQEMSKPVLIAFLISLLTGERSIVDVTFLDKEQIGIYDGDRSLIYDVLCETASSLRGWGVRKHLACDDDFWRVPWTRRRLEACVPGHPPALLESNRFVFFPVGTAPSV